jgi:hypothetical protein
LVECLHDLTDTTTNDESAAGATALPPAGVAVTRMPPGDLGQGRLLVKGRP